MHLEEIACEEDADCTGLLGVQLRANVNMAVKLLVT
jgi:hypothetical protein